MFLMVVGSPYRIILQDMGHSAFHHLQIGTNLFQPGQAGVVINLTCLGIVCM